MRRLLLPLLKILGLCMLALLLAVALNTWRQGSRQLQLPALAPLAVDEIGLGQRLAGAIRARTIASATDAQLNADQFAALHAHLQQSYPRLHARLERETMGGLSLLYRWPGSDVAAKPMLLMAHQDVVPVAPGTEKDWQVEPFAGSIQDGYVWGRGAWDDKGNLIAQLEAIEMLAASGFQPRRTIYLAFGADEEVGGLRGAKAIARTLQERGVKLDFVLDEGLLITEGVMPGLAAPAALVGVAEKGYLSVVLKVPATPGHSSMPPPKGQSAIAMMAAAIKRVDDDQLPAGIKGVAREMFETLAPELSGLQRVALSNLWLFGPLVERQLERGASTQAMLRTTTAPTVFKAGDKDNVMPGAAEATVNFRLLPGDSQAAVMAHVRQAVGSDGKFELYALPGASEPSAVSPTRSDAYRLIERSVREIFPDTIVAPGLMIGATDSRHFEAISEHIYRFSPVRAKPEDLARFHGSNERISTANLAELVRFYHRLVSEAAK